MIETAKCCLSGAAWQEFSITVADAAGKVIGEFRHPDSIARHEQGAGKSGERAASNHRQKRRARHSPAQASLRVPALRPHQPWHHVSNFILARTTAVGLEDLPIAGMLKTRMFFRAIAQAA